MDKRLIKRGHEVYCHKVLSDLMVQVLLYAKWWMNEKGYPPIFSEIEEGTGIHKNTVQHCVEALVKYGYVTWVHPRGRAFVLTYEGQTFTDPRVTNKRNMGYKHQELNDSAYEVMVAINRLIDEKRVPPTETEIMNELGLFNATGIHRQIQTLRDKGYLIDNRNLPPRKRVVIQTAKGLRLGKNYASAT